MPDKNVLSQTEVESLLQAMDKEGDGARQQPATPVKPSSSRPKFRDKVTPYDFKRPERVGKEQMRALQSLHEGFGRNYGAALSALLRCIVEVKLTSVDQLTYSEFVFSLENPTCLNILRAEPLDGDLILDVSPAILYPIIDRLLGGGKEGGVPSRRPLTEIEKRLVSRITGLFLQELKNAWENVLALTLSVQRVESNPQLVQIVPPNEVVIVVSFELTISETRGMINLCIPFTSIERIGHKLVSNTWAGYNRGGADDRSKTLIAQSLEETLLELVVTLAESSITTSDLLGLRVGDIVTTDHDIHKPLDVSIEGITKFFASPGAVKGHKAIQIADPVTPKRVPAE